MEYFVDRNFVNLLIELPRIYTIFMRCEVILLHTFACSMYHVLTHHTRMAAGAEPVCFSMEAMVIGYHACLGHHNLPTIFVP